MPSGKINDIILDDSFIQVISTYPPKLVALAKVKNALSPERAPSLFDLVVNRES